MTEQAPIIISTAFALCAEETRNSRPDLPEQEVKVDMPVIARKKHMKWLRGTIVEIITKGENFKLDRIKLRYYQKLDKQMFVIFCLCFLSNNSGAFVKGETKVLILSSFHS